MHKYHKVLLFVLFLVTQANNVQAGEPALLYVGQSGACTYTSLQAAIDDAFSGDEIRVTNEINDGVLFENISIDKSLTIKGGYSNCGLAQLDSRLDTNRTIIDGTESGNVIKIDGDDLNVYISGFTLTGGVDEGIGANRANGGAVSIRGDDNFVAFENMTISDNHGRRGGGVYITGENHEVTFYNTLIDDNSAVSGGGVYCASSGSRNWIINRAELVVSNNQADGTHEATGHGGGLYLSNCSTNSKVLIITSETILTITNNQAHNSGGGIYAINGSIIFARAVISENQANVDFNATGNGGGIYASSSTIIFDYSELSGNQTHGSFGGGLYAIDSDILVVETNYNNCLVQDELKCLHFIGNRARIGGAMYLDNSDTPPELSFYLKHFTGVYRDNRADFGSAMAITGGSDFSMQNAYIFDNRPGKVGEDSTVYISGVDTQAQFSHTTLANNQTNAVFNVRTAASLDLINSIVHEASDTHAVLVNDLASVHTFCNLYHESNSVMIPVGDNSVVTDDPGFVDPANNDYHLRPDSVAIDFCTTVGLGTIHPDSDLDERPINIPGVANSFLGTYDAGADEVSIELMR